MVASSVGGLGVSSFEGVEGFGVTTWQPTAANALGTSIFPDDNQLPIGIELDSSAFRILSAEAPLQLTIRPAKPATNGAAIEVPSIETYPPPTYVLRISLPGAAT